jgi:DNA polymerase-3 subunit beta
LDAQFPPYEQVMPRSNPIQVSLPADALTKAIKRIATLSPNKGIQVVVNGIVTLSASNPELGEASVEVEPITSNHEGEDLILGLNTTYMLDAIGKKKKTVQMSMAGPLDPVRIDLNDGFTSVLMPMRI